MVDCLLEHGADPYDSVAIDEAANAEILFLLVDRLIFRYSQGNKRIGGKALTLAVKSKDSIMFKKMVEKGLDVTMLLKHYEVFGKSQESENIEEFSSFGYAIFQANKDGEFAFLECILKSGYSPEAVVGKEDVMHLGDRTRTNWREAAFVMAIGTGNISLVGVFVRNRAEVNYFPPGTSFKRTPLQKAAEGGFTEIVQYPIKLGADANAPALRRGDGTAVQLAAIVGYLSIITILIDNAADVDAPASRSDGFTALEAAAKYGATSKECTIGRLNSSF